jgi:hypothetical protein
MNPSKTIVKTVLFLAIYTATNYSCRKDEAVVENPLLIDSTSTTVNRIALKPSYSYRYPHLESFRSTVGYSIDLNDDGENDIEIGLEVLRPMAGNLLAKFLVTIKTPDNKTSVLTDSVYYVFNSTYRGDTLLSENKTRHDELYPRTLKYRDLLKVNDRWRRGTFNLIEYGESLDLTAMTHGNYHSNPWPLTFNNFIGIKCHNRLAWIKLYSDYGCVEIRQAAISK